MGTSHTYAVPMKPGLMLVPPASDDECLTKEDFPYRRAIGALLYLQTFVRTFHKPFYSLLDTVYVSRRTT